MVFVGGHCWSNECQYFMCWVRWMGRCLKYFLERKQVERLTWHKGIEVINEGLLQHFLKNIDLLEYDLCSTTIHRSWLSKTCSLVLLRALPCQPCPWHQGSILQQGTGEIKHWAPDHWSYCQPQTGEGPRISVSSLSSDSLYCVWCSQNKLKWQRLLNITTKYY